jgi:DUF2075 family protein
MAHYVENKEQDGIELYFDGQFPDEELCNQMKAAGLRYTNYKKCWYTKTWNTEGVAFIKRYCGEDVEVPTAAPAPAKKRASTPKKKNEPIMNRRCCYSNSIGGFLGANRDEWLQEMRSAFSDEYWLALGDSQEHAWVDCFDTLQDQLSSLDPAYSIIFEYALPYESGRRPDVILLSKEQVLILEFKMKPTALPEDVDQAGAYARDIREYHFESRDKDVKAVLVLTRAKGIHPTNNAGVTVCSGDCLAETIEAKQTATVTACDLSAWMDSKYEPLPTIVEAARMFMKNEELPHIRRVQSTVIPQTLENLKKLTDHARDTKAHTIAFVTGVPGSGKTYLGLQYVYDIQGHGGAVNSVYLSGNGPLVKVLTDALGSNVFVKDLHKVENEFLRNGAPDFSNNVLVFDEGQRAWDTKQMVAKNRGNFSEPDVMIRLAEQRLEWCVMLILVGEGQEIYNGENSGIGLWNQAMKNGSKHWEMICPPKLADVFGGQTMATGLDPEAFDLKIPLRTHLAGDVSDFVNLLIDGDLAAAAAKVPAIYDQNYNMYYTRDVEKAKQYCRDRYRGEINKRFGLLCSSKAKGLDPYMHVPEFRDPPTNYGKWFNTPQGDSRSCCALTEVVTEFGVQGLELDMPIVGWGTDMMWDGYTWKLYKPNEDEDSDGNTYRVNSYRVLLTRGRDGFIAFIPPKPEMDCIEDLMKTVGVKKL